MKRIDLEHIIRASGAIADAREIVIIGSQSILGAYPQAPADLCMSLEADVYPSSNPPDAMIIDGAIGEGSAFHVNFGYYAQGVGPETAVLPKGWEQRLVRVENPNTNGVAGLCLDPHDLVVSKLYAGRPKDLEFARVAAEHGLVQEKTLAERCQLLPDRQSLVMDRIRGCFSNPPSPDLQEGMKL